jgi:CheY-like chemotaxis protein
MASLPINSIPAEILRRLEADQAVLLCSEQLGDRVLGTTDFNPSSLREMDGLEALSELRQREGVYAITSTILRLTPSVIERAAEGFPNPDAIAAELQALLEGDAEAYLVYVVTHFNHKPMEEMTVFIGGDCYRQEMKDYEMVLSRTKNLAMAMIRKAVLVFPEIPTLHGGKKGEWILVDRAGRKIEGLNDETIVALGTLIIPMGIQFLNRYKEQNARDKGIYDSFPARNSIRPDTASPDVLSGPNWKTMCGIWSQRSIDLAYVTCLPGDLGGPIVPSSQPTGHGAVATALKLADHRFGAENRGKLRFLLEALGGVGKATIEALMKNGVSADQITAFDKVPAACEYAENQYGVKTQAIASRDFYESLTPDQQYDVWINNGEGDNARPEHIQKLLDSGVQIFCGAANNFLKMTDDEEHDPTQLKRESLRRIFSAGAWAWPDEAASGGGWTLAVVDVMTRARGEKSSSAEAAQQIFDIIISENEALVDTVIRDVTTNGRPDGEAIWKRVEQIINERVQTTLQRDVSPDEILGAADVTQWRLA